jgi:Ser/Thr protein kinase RdoA (MazF antagonist)
MGVVAEPSGDHRVHVSAAASAFGLGVVEGEPVVAARGRQGRVWRVKTRRGDLAVKELPVGLTEREVQVDVVLQSTMVNRGVPAPQPLRTTSGAVLVTVGDLQFRAYMWVDLDEPRRDLDPETIGTLMAMLHRDPLPAEASATDYWYTDPVPAQEWQETSERLAVAGAPFAAEFAASVPGFLALQEVFRPSGRTQLCHRDLWADNVRLASEGGLCVIDWDNCGPAESAQELAMPLVEFCYDDGDRAARLYRAYRRADGPGQLADPSDFTMVLAQFGHFAITAARQWAQATDETSKGRAEAWFREGWEQPLGLPEIERLLHAIRDI